MQQDHRHVGIAEIANLLGVTRARASAIARTHADFPEPTDRLAAGPIWHADDVTAWIQDHPQRPAGRPRKLENP